MFILPIQKSYRNEWVCFTLTDCNGKVFQIDIAPLTEMTSLKNMEWPEGDVIYLSVIDRDTDRLKLADRVIGSLPSRNLHDFQWKVLNIVKSWSHGNKNHGHPIRCNETGEEFLSAKACADAHGLSYSQLTNHLKNMIGYRTVKGRTYRKIGA